MKSNRWIKGWVLVLVLAMTAPLAAADKIKPGDEVEVLQLGEWIRGTVVSLDRRGYMVEFPWAGGNITRPFGPDAVREALEPGTLSKERTWTDITGKFKIKAVLIAIDDKEVTLRKPDDTEVTLPLTKLSVSDKQLIKSIAKARATAGPAAAGPAGFPPMPPGFPGTPGREPGPELGPVPDAQQVQSFATNATVTVGNENVTKPTPLVPDPLPSHLKLQEGGAVVQGVDFFDEVTSILPVGGKDMWLLAGIGSKRPDDTGVTRLVWCSLAKKKADKQQLLPSGEEVVDYHAASHRLLTFSREKEAGQIGPGGKATLSLWEVLPTDKEAKPIARWSIDSGDDRHRPDDPWARLLTGDLVFSRYGESDIALWDVTKKSLRYRLSQEAFAPGDPTLSPGRKYLFIPERSSVRIHEAESGKLVSVLPTARDAMSVGISDDGQRAIVRELNQLSLWDLTVADAKPTTAPTAGTFQDRDGSVTFLDKDRVLIMDRGFSVLYSLKEGMPIWSYILAAGGINRNSYKVLTSHLAYSVKMHGRDEGLAIGAVKLPGPGVDQALAKANRTSALLLKPGVAVKLDIQAGDHTAQVKAALEKKVVANGWTLSPDAPVVILAEMKRGEQQNITYETFGPQRERTSVSLVPHITSLAIKSGDKSAWSAGHTTRAPSFVRLEEGQTLQGEVDKWQKPDPAFFDRLQMPREILNPAHARGFGGSHVTSQGLEVLPDAPPGQ